MKNLYRECMLLCSQEDFACEGLLLQGRYGNEVMIESLFPEFISFESVEHRVTPESAVMLSPISILLRGSSVLQ